jgi:hypothetical protein
VKLAGLTVPMVLALQIAEHIWWQHGETTLVVTSANDGAHRAGSLHYEGRAVDLRTKTLPQAQRQAAVEALARALGGEFVVLFESVGDADEHCHVHWQG